VVDVGNTRIKWGRCTPDAVTDQATLPPDDPAVWEEQLQQWELSGPLTWAVTGVHPGRRDALVAWLRRRGHTVHVIDGPSQLPLRTCLEHPERAGIDRLLDAVAANSRRRAGIPAVVIDAGSAVTVDWLDETGAFAGGAILPGLRLAARALHEHTALLPLVEPPVTAPPLPGVSTTAALEAGVFWTVAGGVRAVVEEMSARSAALPDLFLTGGDGHRLHAALGPDVQLWPQMTLEGIRLSAVPRES
jgi:type III pantothenate kinase